MYEARRILQNSSSANQVQSSCRHQILRSLLTFRPDFMTFESSLSASDLFVGWRQV